MMQVILGLRTQLVPDDHDHADGLLTTLGRLESDQVIASSDSSKMPDLLMPTLRLGAPELQAPAAYGVSFYNREYGDLEEVGTLDSFDAGVQLVRDRLAISGHYLIEANWSRHQGEMTVSTPRSMVVARIDAADDGAPPVQPSVRQACSALQPGDASSIEQLFDRLPEAA